MKEERSAFEPTYSTFTEHMWNWLRVSFSFFYLTLPVLIPVSLILAFINVFAKVIPKPVDLVGNLMILSGAIFVASGVVLNRKARFFFLTVKNQESENPTRFMRKTDTLRMLRRLLRHLTRGARPESVRRAYIRSLWRLHTRGEFRYIITQKFLSQLFIDSSDRAEIGTFLMVTGTIIVMLASRLEN